MAERQIVGLGGAASTEEETRRLLAHVVGLAGKSSPKVCFVPTAMGDDAESVPIRVVPIQCFDIGSRSGAREPGTPGEVTHDVPCAPASRRATSARR